MGRVEDLASPTGRYSWSSMTSGHVTEKCDTLCSKGDVCQLEVRVRSMIGLYLGILLLSHSHGCVVDAQLHFVYESSGQCVSDKVALPLHMKDVCCELRDVGELALLAI